MTNLLTNLGLLSVGIATAANILLGLVVYLSNKKSQTNNYFFLFTFISSIWGIFNFLLYQFQDTIIILWFIRLVMFCAIWQAYSFFLLTYVYPEEQKDLPVITKKYLIWIVIITSIITLTPIMYSSVIPPKSIGQVAEAVPGPGVLIFAIVAIGLVIVSIIQLIKRHKKIAPTQRTQLNLLFAGTAMTFLLIITFNFIAPNFFQNYNYIPLGSVFVFPFIIFTAYAILKHHLFNAKVISTEIATFLLLVASLVEIVLSKTSFEITLRFVIFLILLAISTVLLRSVRKEVEQREQLEILTKELENANEKLKALDKARAEFITIASHQLRTPPATIKWYLSSVLDGDYGKVPKELKDILEKTNRTNNSLISLVDDMLNVSRIERGKMEFLFQESNLLELAKTTFEQLEPIAKEKGLKLTFKYLPKTKFPKLMADKEKVRQVMNNLIDNAIKYTKQGSVAVMLSADNQEIKFSVTDSGKGITPEEKESIFEKFSRGKESVKQSAGLGLGLYVAKIIIAQHKGKIWAESPGDGMGSSFIFTLPINNELKETTLVDLAKNQG
ncbi:MAG: hypothetical protein HY918_00600 [Candidatus Doudnabacteria bacterium]|nr:hypothetical protein [Candidatus Doudnabacteria bacterium]